MIYLSLEVLFYIFRDVYIGNKWYDFSLAWSKCWQYWWFKSNSQQCRSSCWKSSQFSYSSIAEVSQTKKIGQNFIYWKLENYLKWEIYYSKALSTTTSKYTIFREIYGYGLLCCILRYITDTLFSSTISNSSELCKVLYSLEKLNFWYFLFTFFYSKFTK